ncbi:winged helix-turn-helix domain-containing protein [Rubricoccus marinus]|nr:winged helix-turn-helix domain-containing protein [Rubricoccus marinus]
MANRLRRGDEVRRIEPKVMEVLVCMARRPGETVTRDEFMADVWEGTIVTDDVLARCISELRKALGDRARNPSYVETIRKRGYRLIADVEDAPEARADTRIAAGARITGGRAGAPASARESRRADLLRRRQRRRLSLVLGILLALTLVGAGAFIAIRVYTSQFRPLAAVPVTSLPGVERDPALSPNGSRVAFAWDGGGDEPFNIYIKDASEEAAGSMQQLTDSPADDHSPAWSPDGERLAFARCTEDGCGVYTVSASGGTPALLSDLERFQVRNLVWSPDGLRLAFAGRQGGSGAFGVHLLPLDGSAPQRLTAPPATYPGDLDPAFSPDGLRLAFVRTALDGRQDVCTVSASGGTVSRLVLEQKGVTGLDWSADGREIVYAANRDGAAGLWRIGVNGGRPRWIALGTDGGEVSEPSIADNGSGLAFARRLSRTQIVGVYPGGEPVPLLSSTREDTQPNVSRDGSKIAFVSTRSGSHEVWVSDARGENPRRLTQFNGPRVSTPRWSPDGQSIVLAARRQQGDTNLFIVGADGEVRTLTSDPGDEVAPSWSRDGEWIYFASQRTDTWQIYRMPAAGGDAQVITRYGGVSAMEASDGALLVVRHDRNGLWRLPPGPDGIARDNSITRLRANVAPADWANWTVDGAWAYVLERRIDGGALVVRVETGRNVREDVAQVSDVPDQPGLAVLPGGERILVTQIERGESDIAFVPDFR